MPMAHGCLTIVFVVKMWAGSAEILLFRKPIQVCKIIFIISRRI
jgi:hypothetical protein